MPLLDVRRKFGKKVSLARVALSSVRFGPSAAPLTATHVLRYTMHRLWMCKSQLVTLRYVRPYHTHAKFAKCCSICVSEEVSEMRTPMFAAKPYGPKLVAVWFLPEVEAQLVRLFLTFPEG